MRLKWQYATMLCLAALVFMSQSDWPTDATGAEATEPAASDDRPADAALATYLGMTIDEFQSLSVQDQGIYAECEPMIASNPSGPLRLLMLPQFTALNDVDIERIFALPRIRAFYLTGVTDRSLSALKSVQGIRELSLNGMFSDGVVRELIDVQPDLEYLDVFNPSEETMKVIGRRRHLESLSAVGVRCRHGGLHHLSDLPHLRSLAVTSNDIDERGIGSLALLPRLERLSLNGGDHLSNDAISQLAHLQGLVELQMDTRARTTPEAYKDFHRLSRLTRLQPPRSMPDDALPHITKLPSLEYLDLLNSENVTDRWIPDLLDIRSLKWLNVGGGKVSSRMQARVNSWLKVQHESGGIARPSVD